LLDNSCDGQSDRLSQLTILTSRARARTTRALHHRSGITGIHGAAGNPTKGAETLGGLSAFN
jgi:hypothetical protein